MTEHAERRVQPAAPAGAGGRRQRALLAAAWPRLSALIVVVGVLALWELLTRTNVVSSRDIPPATDIAVQMWTNLSQSSFWTAVWNTIEGWLVGLAIATGLALPLGMLIGSYALVYRGTRVIVEFLRPIPSVALIPLAVLIYGSGFESKVFLVSFAAFWPMLVQVLYGAQNMDRVLVETAQAYNLGAAERLRWVRLPSALPFIVTGFRISSAVALILAITAEIVIGAPGIGHEIELARSGGDVDEMYALIAVTGILGWLLNVAMMRAEHRVLGWHPSHRRTV